MEVSAEGIKSKNVLIYCQNGSSASCLLSSLAQILLDPFYRTFAGFRILIYKEWVYYGHNFYKSNNLSKETNPGCFKCCYIDNELPSLALQNFSPLFILFLDCVYQLLTQNPTEFQFTEGYLAYFGYHCFTSNFYEFKRQGHLDLLNQQQISFKGS